MTDTKRDALQLKELRAGIEKGSHRWNCSRSTLKTNGGRCNCGLTALQKRWGMRFEGFADPARRMELTQ